MSNKMSNTEFFIKYLIEEAHFNPSDYKMILELNGSARDSISRYLTECKQYLVSPSIHFSNLLEFGIYGRRGKIKLDKDKKPYICTNRKYSDYDFFDVIVSRKYSNNLFAACHFDKDIYFGFCDDYYHMDYSIIEKKLNYYIDIRNYLNNLGKNYELINDVDTSNDKIFCIVKNKENKWIRK
ncbi:MAG: hypothetical protein PUD59_05840 [bacterium]|nr:hypothetical protein [bacterium]